MCVDRKRHNDNNSKCVWCGLLTWRVVFIYFVATVKHNWGFKGSANACHVLLTPSPALLHRGVILSIIHDVVAKQKHRGIILRPNTSHPTKQKQQVTHPTVVLRVSHGHMLVKELNGRQYLNNVTGDGSDGRPRTSPPQHSCVWCSSSS